MNGSNDKGYATRVCDTPASFGTKKSPIEGYENFPLVSLERAVEPLEAIVPRVQQMVWIVKSNCETPPDDLSPDESASIMLYTLSCKPEEQSFYYILNSMLREGVNLNPWLLYLKLVITALSKITSKNQSVYRGVKKSLMKDFHQGKTFFWWTLTSCTTSIEVLQSEQFLGKTGKRTMFIIECWTGKDIRKHSMIKKENEILLLPGCQFKVVATSDLGNDLNMVQIQEIYSQNSLFEPLQTTGMPTGHKSLAVAPLTKTQIYASYRNVSLEQVIQKCRSRTLDLTGHHLNDADVVILNEQGIIGKKLKTLNLMYTEITQRGVSILSNAIHSNEFLEDLNISHNSISDLGVKYLAPAVKDSVLKHINLSENDISNEGTQYLAQMLEGNMKLIELSLKENQITVEGVKMLADVLSHRNTALQVLNLSANTDINDESIDTLIYMLERNQTLEKLDLRHCGFSKEGEKTLKNAIVARKQFQLWLSHII